MDAGVCSWPGCTKAYGLTCPKLSAVQQTNKATRAAGNNSDKLPPDGDLPLTTIDNSNVGSRIKG
jgi:hypothetical protein